MYIEYVIWNEVCNIENEMLIFNNESTLEKENISEKKFKIIVKINTLSNIWNIIESVRFKIWLRFSKFFRNSIGMIYFQKSWNNSEKNYGLSFFYFPRLPFFLWGNSKKVV